MVAIHEKLIDENPQCEPIMRGRAVHRLKMQPLEFWRRVLRFAHGRAEEPRRLPLGNSHLEGVCIKQSHKRGAGNQRVTFVQISHDIAGIMCGLHGGGQIPGGTVSVSKVEIGQ
jgi:hypothetical protein